MPTLLDWNALEGKARSYIGQYDDCTSPQTAFNHIVLEYVLSLDPEEIEDSITDGSRDRGIDAVYIDDRDGRNTIHLFQFKHVDSFDKSKRNFPSSEIDKLLSFCSDVLEQDANLKKTCNPFLWEKIQEIWEALKRPSPTFEVHLSGNMLPLIPDERKRIDGSLAKYRTFHVNEHTLETVVAMFIERKQPKLDAQLKVVDNNYFERIDGNIRGLIATIEASEIISLITDPDDPSSVRPAIFNDNVRVYLTKKNQINRKIIASALSDKNAEFWYLNNGITMTCDSFFYQAGQRAPLVSLKNVQIVNGGQTSHALFEAKKEEPERVKKVLVLARIYETKTREISSHIAESTNSQTPINTRDLRSNDDIQKTLEESFRDLGFFYERKAKQHSEQPKTKRIDALSAGQSFLAYCLGMPEVAKKDRSRVFSDLYDQVFNDTISPPKLHVPLKLLAGIENTKRDVQKKIRGEKPVDARLLFIIDGAYHVLFAVAALCEHNSVDPLDEAKARAFIPKAIDLVSRIVDQEIKSDKAFTFNRFFKDAKTKTKIETSIGLKRTADKRGEKKGRTLKGLARRRSATNNPVLNKPHPESFPLIYT